MAAPLLCPASCGSSGASGLVPTTPPGLPTLAFHTRRADVLVVAAGKAGLVKGDMVKPGAVVVDVGINRVKVEGSKKSKIVGDVEFDAAAQVASLITPVPGGVGLVTTALLLANVVECARRQS